MVSSYDSKHEALGKAVDILRSREEDLLAFETAHPSVVDEKADDSGSESSKGTHQTGKHHGASVAHNVGAKHQSDLEARYNKLKEKVVQAGLTCEVLRGKEFEQLGGMMKFEDALRACMQKEAEQRGTDIELDFEWL